MPVHALPSKRSNKRNIPDLGERVDVAFIAFLLGYTRQHTTRLCRAAKVPGAYTSKGGHWRARWSESLASWVRQNQTFKTQDRNTRGRAWAKVWDELQAANEAMQLLAVRKEKLTAMLAKLEKAGVSPMAQTALLESPFRGIR
jgi:hypothetical protein